jgi:hypothetical protein
MDEPERQFGSTHILAIPLAPSFDSLEYEDQPVSITVDLRYGRIKSFVLRHRTFEKSTLFRRAGDLTDALAQVKFAHIRYSIVYDYLTEEDAGE